MLPGKVGRQRAVHFHLHLQLRGARLALEARVAPGRSDPEVTFVHGHPLSKDPAAAARAEWPDISARTPPTLCKVYTMM